MTDDQISLMINNLISAKCIGKVLAYKCCWTNLTKCLAKGSEIVHLVHPRCIVRKYQSLLVSWFSEQRKSKTPGWRVQQCSDVSLGNECKNELQTHTQESLYDTYFKHGIGWHTTQCGKGYCQWYEDFQGNDGHFIGYWLIIVYFSNILRKLSRFPNEQFVHAWFIQLQLSVSFYFKLFSQSLLAPYAPWQWHITL